MKTKGQKLVLFHYIEIMIASALAVIASLLCAKFPADSTVIIAVALVLFFLEGYLATKILKKVIVDVTYSLTYVVGSVNVRQFFESVKFICGLVRKSIIDFKSSQLIGKNFLTKKVKYSTHFKPVYT